MVSLWRTSLPASDKSSRDQSFFSGLSPASETVTIVFSLPSLLQMGISLYWHRRFDLLDLLASAWAQHFSSLYMIRRV